MEWLARKPIADLRAEAAIEGEIAALPRSLGMFSMTCFGVGSTIGAGVFVLTGTVAAQHAGPAVSVSFLLASFVCLLAGLCYAEMASMIPVAGSAYSYTYATMGEGVAWTIGWCLILEYLFSGSIVAIGWSGYAQSALHDLGIDLPFFLTRAPIEANAAGELVWTGAYVDLPAVFVTLLCMVVVLGGVRFSAGLNNVMVALKVLAIIAISAVGFWHVDVSNWSQFVPDNAGAYGAFGWSGVLQGTAILFFAYVGFDAVSTMGQEAKNPQRNIPLSLMASLAICALLYVTVSLVVTGLAPYQILDVPDPIYAALEQNGSALGWAKAFIGIIAVFGLVSVLMVTILGQVRIFFAMSRDGLLPEFFSHVHPRSKTPYIGTLVTGTTAALSAGVLPLGLLGELISIGTLLAFATVCIGVIVLRQTFPEMNRPFRVPFAPWIPLGGAAASIGLMASLPIDTWVRLVVWLGLGAAIYLIYGTRHSKLRIAGRARPLEAAHVG